MLQNLLIKSRTLNPLKIYKNSLFNNISVKNPSIIHKRSYFFWKRKISAEKYRTIDNIPKEYDLVYRCTMDYYVTGTQLICSISVLSGTALFLFNLYENQDLKISQELIEEYSLVNEENQAIFFAVGFIFLNVAACYLATKFPLRIYFNEQTKNYLGVLCNIFPTKRSFVSFNAGELKKKSFGLLPWKQHTYKTKSGSSIIILDQYFRKPFDMNVMMGHVKVE